MRILLIILLALLWIFLIVHPAGSETAIKTYFETYSDQFIASTSVRIPPKRTEIEKMIYSTFGTQVALDVAKCESGLNPLAVNNNPKTRDFSVGLFQINLYGDLAKKRPAKEWLLIPENNIKYAYEMYLRSGWSPWACARGL